MLGEGEGFVDGEGDGETAGVSVGSSTTSETGEMCLSLSSSGSLPWRREIDSSWSK